MSNGPTGCSVISRVAGVCIRAWGIHVEILGSTVSTLTFFDFASGHSG